MLTFLAYFFLSLLVALLVGRFIGVMEE